jgi:hypothetical protein
VGEVVLPGLAGPDFLDQPGAVAGEAPADGPCRLIRLRHVVQAVEGQDQAEHRLARQLAGGSLVEGNVAQSPPGEVAAGPPDRVPGRIVAIEAGSRERAGQGEQGDSAAAAHVGDADSGFQPPGDAVQRGQDRRYQREP